MKEYNFKTLIQNSLVLYECRTCIYGLQQAGCFSYIKLVKHLADDCYFPTEHKPGLFGHLTLPTTFNLVVGSFGAKIFGKHNYDHLINTFKKHNNVTIDWNGEIFCVIKLKWDYDKKTVDPAIPNYVNKALARLHNYSPIKPPHHPHPYNAPVCR